MNDYRYKRFAFPIGFSIVIPAFVLVYPHELPGYYDLIIITLILSSNALWLFYAIRIKKHFHTYSSALRHVIKANFFNDGKATESLGIEALRTYFENATAFINRIGDGDLRMEYPGINESIKGLNDANLTGAMLRMKSKLVDLAEAERQRNWVTTGLAEFSAIVRDQHRSFEDILHDFMARAIHYTGANQGAIFLANGASDRVQLELKACYAYNRRKFIEKTIAPGEGLVGQAYLEGELVLLTQVPKDYLHITSGLGEAVPRCVVLIPLKHHGRVEGILEMASFQQWETYKLDFLLRIGEVLASASSYIKSVAETKTLLETSQLQAMQLRTREEALKQNLEELHAVKEAVERKSKEATEQNIRLNAVLDSTADTIMTLDHHGLIESINLSGMKLLQYEERELIGKPVKCVIPENDAFSWHNRQHAVGKVVQTVIMNKQHEIIPVELLLNKTFSGDHQLFTAIVTNISARLKAEQDQLQYIEELRAQEEALRQNMEELHATQEEIHRQMIEISDINGELDARVAALNTTTIMSESDVYGTILFVNDKFLEVSQYTREELIGKPHNVVRHPDMPPAVFKLMWTTIKAGKVFRGIVKNRKKDGTHYWVDAVISPVLNSEGKPIKYIGVRYVIEDDEQAEKLFNKAGRPLQTRDTCVSEAGVATVPA